MASSKDVVFGREEVNEFMKNITILHYSLIQTAIIVVIHFGSITLK